MAAVYSALFLLCISLICIADGADPKATPDKKVVCYYTSWSQGRKSPYNFTPDKMDPFVCTHIIYAFATFGEDYNLAASNPAEEITNHGYENVTKLKEKNPALKVLLGTGGWRDGSLGFAEITSNSTTRERFARQAVGFLRKLNFDGMDLNWQHPTFREGGKPQDKESYVALAKILQEEFEKDAAKNKKPKLLLSIGISHHLKSLPGYDIEGFNKYTDFISVICYDYSFSYVPSVNHHSPLYALPGADEEKRKLNVNHTINYFLQFAAPEKLVLGIPTYGRSYKLEHLADRDVGADADGPGNAGPYTGEKGFLAYYEICTNIQKNNWTVVDAHPNAMGPYAYKGDQWVGFDDIKMVKHKTAYAKEKGLSGVMFWTVDYDDFLGTCHDNKKFPLINAAKEELFKI